MAVNHPKKKLDAVIDQMNWARENQVLPATALACIIGMILSMSFGPGPVMRLMMQGMYTVLNARVSWSQQVLLTSEALEELVFWLEHISSLNG